MKPKFFHLVMSVLGAVLPYSQFVPWLAEHGLNARLFGQQLFATRISAFLALDVIVSAVVLLRFIRAESSRLRIPYAWRFLQPYLGESRWVFRCFFIFAKFNWSEGRLKQHRKGQETESANLARFSHQLR